MLNIQEIKCKNCGANLRLFLSLNRATCEHCGTNYYVETVGTKETPSRDNPVSVIITRVEEDDSPKELMTHTYNQPTYNSLRDYLCFLAGFAYILKKSYKIKPMSFPFEGAHNKSRFNDNYKINTWKARSKERQSKRENREWWKAENRFNAEDYINWQERLSKENHEYIEVFRNELNKCGFIIEETVTQEKSKNIVESFDQHTFLLKLPIITPNFFETHFTEVYQKYQQIKDSEAIIEIGSLMSQNINRLQQAVDSNVVIAFDVVSFEVSWKSLHSNSVMGSVNFHDIGMNFIESPITLSAVRVASIEKVIEMTSKEGRNLLDLGQTIYHVADDNSWNDKSGFILRYLEDSIKQYQTW